MNQSFFRSEVPQSNQVAWVGKIHINKNPRFSAVASLALLLICGLIAFCVLGEVTRKVRIFGVLIPELGVIQLSALSAGVINEQMVKEGEHVTAGQILFVIGTDRPTREGATSVLLSAHLAQRRMIIKTERSSRIQQIKEKDSALLENIRSLESEIAQAKNEVILINRRIDLAQKTSTRYQQLAQDGFVSEIQLQNKQEELIDHQAKMETAQRSASLLKREQQRLKTEQKANQQQLNIDLLGLDRAEASLGQETTENQSNQTIAIKAPQTGVISTIYLPKGSFVQAGHAVATFLPTLTNDPHVPSELTANLFAPSRAIGFIKPEQTVWMRYEAYPYQKFALAQGRVKNISTTPTAFQNLPDGQAAALMGSAQTQEPLYRIQVQLNKQSINAYGENFPLKPGMKLDADIFQDRRMIWEWVFEPLISIQKK